MDRAQAGAVRGRICPGCAAELGRPRESGGGDANGECSRCGGSVSAEGDGPEARRTAEATSAQQRAAPLGGLRLAWRNWILRLIERLYWTGTLAGALLMLACGGIVPVVRVGCATRSTAGRASSRTLGGVWFPVETLDPDSDLGPVLARVDAPLLFATIDTVGRRLGVKPPGQVRLTYLPCCGVVAWGRSRALIIGLPLFRVLTQGELRAIVAHELAHLARGDATARGPVGPVRRGAGAGAGARPAATPRAARRLGPLLPARGVLADRARGARPGGAGRPVRRGDRRRQRRRLGAGQGRRRSAAVPRGPRGLRPERRRTPATSTPFSATFWYRLPADVHTAMRLSVLTRRHDTPTRRIPPCPTAIASLQAYPDPAELQRRLAARPPRSSATSKSSSRCSTTGSSAFPPSSPACSTGPAR